MKILSRILWTLLVIGILGAATGVALLATAYLYISPDLPPVESLRDVQYQVPLRVYTRDGLLMAEFGEKRRDPVDIEDVPDLMIKAFLAAEDDRFFEHPGVDYQGLLRAAIQLALTGTKRQGGSTITMQVARNFFLSRDKTYLRKLSEIFLALHIEQVLSKEKILALYLNKIYLGNRAYGVAAAARVYYGLPLADLSVAQIAMIAGLPKAPSSYNPLANAQRAHERRDYVLRRMHDLGFLDDEAWSAAVNEPLTARRYSAPVETRAPYVAEMVRAEMVQRFGQAAYTEGYSVYTTIDSRLQPVAEQAVHSGVMAYEERHGYRGPEQRDIAIPEPPAWPESLGVPQAVGPLLPGLVVRLDEAQAGVILADGRQIDLPFAGMSWARSFITTDSRGPKPEQPADVLAIGDRIRVRQNREGEWRLAQLPVAQGVLVSVSPEDGAVRALVGGFDFPSSKFNRAAQAERQPGSGFKPFVYSAALDAGFTAATLVNDAPVVFDDPGLEAAWRPENYSGKFHGPTRLRVALAKSRNLVSIRLMRSLGIRNAIRYLEGLGFERGDLPRNLSLALGTLNMTPLEMAGAYTMFANGGFRVWPWFLQRIEDRDGQTVYLADPVRVCRVCPPEGMEGPAGPPPPRSAQRVLEAGNHYIMNSMLQGVVQAGTARRARALGRSDLGGKTGTTNDQRDAWFFGYQPDHVAVAWLGVDDNRPLGNYETGGKAALPIWIEYMEQALKDVPERSFPVPPGLVTVRIDPESGLRAPVGTPDALFEVFRPDHVPEAEPERHEEILPSGDTDEESLF